MSLPGFLSWLEERPGVLGPARLSGAGTTNNPRTLVAADDVYEGATLRGEMLLLPPRQRHLEVALPRVRFWTHINRARRPMFP